MARVCTNNSTILLRLLHRSHAFDWAQPWTKVPLHGRRWLCCLWSLKLSQRWNLILISYDVIKHQTNQTSALTPTTSTLASTRLTSSEPSSSLTVPCVASRRRPWASNKHHHLTSVLQKNQWSCSRRHCFITSTYPGSISICTTASERAFTQGFSNLTKWIIFHWNIERTTLTEESLLIGQKVIG